MADIYKHKRHEGRVMSPKGKSGLTLTARINVMSSEGGTNERQREWHICDIKVKRLMSSIDLCHRQYGM